MISKARLAPLITAVVFSVLCLSACINVVRPNFETELQKLRSGEYELDPAHAVLLFKVEHLGLSLYVGRFNVVRAELDFDANNPESAKLEGSVELSSVDTNNDDVETLLQEPAWFDVQRHPEARFTTDSVTLLDNGEMELRGQLSLRGITQPVVFLARFNGGADNLLTRRYTLGFTATGAISRAAFGMDSFSGLVADEVALEIHAEFLRK